jgi:hypothetical protein
MTEADWNSCTDPRPMLKFLCGLDGLVTRTLRSLILLRRPALTRRTSDRKLLLFACACCRRIWHLLSDERLRQGVEVSERYADGQADEGALAEVRASIGAHGFFAALGADDASIVVHNLVRWDGGALCVVVGAWTAFGLGTIPEMVAEAARDALGRPWARQESGVQCALLRNIVGNPFRPLPPLAPPLLAWNGGVAVQLALAAYNERSMPSGHLDPARLAVLADALEEAVAPEEVLAHLRAPGPHWRGFWAVDHLLGKS